jgi:predicted metalloenzyme YecM
MPHNDLTNILGSPVKFLEDTISLAEELGLPLKGFEIDHLCFRCESIEQYKQLCTSIVTLKLGTLLLEGMIGGRPISTIQFTTPLIHKEWTISCLELTCPKAGRNHNNGFEHIEVVVDPTSAHGFVNSVAFLNSFADGFPTIEFDRKAINKEINADLSVTLSNGASVKFHARPLYEVCAYEVENNHFIPVPSDYFNEIAKQ